MFEPAFAVTAYGICAPTLFGRAAPLGLFVHAHGKRRIDYSHMHADLCAEHSCLYCSYYLEAVALQRASAWVSQGSEDSAPRQLPA